MYFGTVSVLMNLRDVKLSSRAVIPVALAIPLAPSQLHPHQRQLPQLLAGGRSEALDDRGTLSYIAAPVPT